VVIDDFDVVGVTLEPDKTKTPLIVYANAVLCLSFALQCFQPVSRQSRKCPDVRSSIQQIQLPQGLSLNRFESEHRLAVKKPLSVRTAKGTDHTSKLYWSTVNVNQYSQNVGYWLAARFSAS
jgi:hypothetical protein